VVDLAAPRTKGKAADERFVRRVYKADERVAIASSPDPDLEIWCRWAAKETGYKVVSKLLGAPPPFVHQAFHVVWAPRDDALQGAGGESVLRTGAVHYGATQPGSGGGLQAIVTVEIADDALHAVGFGAPGGVLPRVPLERRVALLDERAAPWAGSLQRLTERLSSQERDAVYSRSSAAVRLGARAHLAEALGIEEARIEIVCAPGPASQRPPHVLVDGEPAAADVSLSHDGQWIAWVIWTG
jgi:hypothetical protein